VFVNCVMSADNRARNQERQSSVSYLVIGVLYVVVVIFSVKLHPLFARVCLASRVDLQAIEIGALLVLET